MERLGVNIASVVSILIGLGLLSYLGMRFDPEFNEPSVFLKHKPALKFRFYSPLGDSDLTIENLSIERKKSELDWREYVDGRKLANGWNTGLALLFWGLGWGGLMIGVWLFLSRKGNLVWQKGAFGFFGTMIFGVVAYLFVLMGVFSLPGWALMSMIFALVFSVIFSRR